MDETNELVKIEIADMPTKHQLAVVVLGSIAGFIAGRLTQKAYAIGFNSLRNRQVKNAE